MTESDWLMIVTRMKNKNVYEKKGPNQLYEYKVFFDNVKSINFLFPWDKFCGIWDGKTGVNRELKVFKDFISKAKIFN